MLQWFLTRNRFVQLAIVLLPIALLVALSLTKSEDEWVPLAEGRDVSWREQARQKLSEKGILVQAHSSTLRVRKKDHPKAVLALAADGGLRDAELFRFLEDANFTSTHWQMDKRWQLALQRKLEAMITEIESVRDARVQISPGSESSILGGRSESTKASVVMTLKEGRTELGLSEVQGIAHLVAAAVPGLKPEGVRIMDRQGRLYKTSNDDDRFFGASDRHALERRYERDLENKAQKVLAPLFPRAAVSATVKLSSRRIVQRDTQVAPGSVAKFVEEVSTSQVKGQRTLAFADFAPEEGAAQETRRQIEIGPGELEQVSMAIVLPSSDEASVGRLKSLVHNATAIPESDISIQATPQPTKEPETTPPTPTVSATSSFPFLDAALVLSAALVGFLLGRRRRLA